VFHLTELRIPIVQAPMAGGPTTPALAIAVSDVGGLGFLAAGYRAPNDLRGDIAEVRAATGKPFRVNIFVPSPTPADKRVVDAYLAELAPEAERLKVKLGAPRFDDDAWQEKLELVCDERVHVVSFTFGCPAPGAIERLHRAGIAVWATVTNPREAQLAQEAGADVLVAQGTEAGGHRGSFVDEPGADGLGLIALLRLLAGRVSRPLVGSGGIADGQGVAAALAAGASAVQIGTALMLTPEAGTPDSHRAMLRTPTPTALTRAFSGRLARGIVNRFMVEHSATAPIAYPEINYATGRLRAAARSDGDTDAFNLWAGQAHELAQRRPAADVVTTMAADAIGALRDAQRALAKQSEPVPDTLRLK
jgi:nitronate monooxygenase